MQNDCNFDSPLPCLLLVLQQHMILTLHSLPLHTILIVLSNTNVFSNETLIWMPYTQKLLRPLIQIHKHTFGPYSLQSYLLLVGKGRTFIVSMATMFRRFASNKLEARECSWSWIHAPSCPDHTNISIRFQSVKLLGIMLRNRCWFITFHTITAENTDGWCQK